MIDPLHVALLGIIGGVGSAFVGAAVGRRSANLCDKCGIKDIKVDLVYLCALVRLLSEHAGITQEAQIELEQKIRLSGKG